MAYNVKVEPVENDYNDRNRLIISDDSGERDHWDGGEPEDNSFLRDWGWVADELRGAYGQGKKDAQGTEQAEQFDALRKAAGDLLTAMDRADYGLDVYSLAPNLRPAAAALRRELGKEQ